MLIVQVAEEPRFSSKCPVRAALVNNDQDQQLPSGLALGTEIASFFPRLFEGKPDQTAKGANARLRVPQRY